MSMPNVSMLMYLFGVYHLVGGLEHEIYDFPFSWECHHPNWRTHIFQRGRSTTNQIIMGIFNGNIARYFVEFQGITFIMEIFFCGGMGAPPNHLFFQIGLINYKPPSAMGILIYNSNNNGNRMQILWENSLDIIDIAWEYVRIWWNVNGDIMGY